MVVIKTGALMEPVQYSVRFGGTYLKLGVQTYYKSKKVSAKNWYFHCSKLKN